MTEVLFEPLCRRAVNPAVNRHKVHAVLGMHFYHIHPLVRRYVLERFIIIYDCVIDRNCTDHSRAFRREFPSEFLRISIGTQIHNRLSPHIYSRLYLLHLYIEIQAVTARSQIYIYFCF